MKFKIPGGYMTVSILLAVIAHLILQNFPHTIQDMVIESFVTPILDKLLGIVIAVNIPMIFISIVASICSIEDTSMLNSIGKKILQRFLWLQIIIAIITMFISNLFFPVIKLDFSLEFLYQNALELRKIFQLILHMIPDSLFAPFVEGDIFQVVFLAIFTGICIVYLENRVVSAKDLIMDLKEIIFKMVKITLKIIPLIIFLCIFKALSINSLSSLFGIWKIVALNYLIYFLLGAVFLLTVKFKYDVSIKDFVKKVYPACMISFTTGSSTAAIPKNLEICKDELKIDENLSTIYIPLSHSIFPITMLTGILTYTFYAAEYSHMQISIAELIVLLILSIQFAISTIRADGGMVAIMSLLLEQLNLSLTAIGPIMITNVFFVNISGAISVIVRDCDLIDFYHQVNSQAVNYQKVNA